MRYNLLLTSSVLFSSVLATWGGGNQGSWEDCTENESSLKKRTWDFYPSNGDGDSDCTTKAEKPHTKTKVWPCPSEAPQPKHTTEEAPPYPTQETTPSSEQPTSYAAVPMPSVPAPNPSVPAPNSIITVTETETETAPCSCLETLPVFTTAAPTIPVVTPGIPTYFSTHQPSNTSYPTASSAPNATSPRRPAFTGDATATMASRLSFLVLAGAAGLIVLLL
ncbi:uncharacterized protein L3040_004839 [Drepanopeziza brunnea f. sp. 'multigermtubi']|uniref:Uncharacterized protein n=1 Tax=Marssonina brunnea f. sp. multigermtubi (strain MB_m1) TaxID=1072389 RepID=K1WVG9_MARBU|nr:uncharacterized protein MBM_00728 [Drepanopeziza brunnea f. sp. 'multigermtubi' MB_m1]EKD21615.1 hypothetical protein MBM_00728 [Drepanopeziza brunnea f. sp. 'multigermtubi' MB_m1]KAJ5042287.1 hypothetical protein L3040_004839 [Drepanopeziza brunnea f. sp. 'multigermtubi']